MRKRVDCLREEISMKEMEVATHIEQSTLLEQEADEAPAAVFRRSTSELLVIHIIVFELCVTDRNWVPQ